MGQRTLSQAGSSVLLPSLALAKPRPFVWLVRRFLVGPAMGLAGLLSGGIAVIATASLLALQIQ